MREREEAGLATDDFRDVFRDHPAGVAVISGDAGDGPIAMTVSSLCSVSADPPLLLFSLSDHSSSSGRIAACDTVVVHMISAAEVELAKLGAARGVDRFATELAWARTDAGEPYYVDARNKLRGRIVQRIRAGAATLVVVQALEKISCAVAEPKEGAPLVYHNRLWYALDQVIPLAS